MSIENEETMSRVATNLALIAGAISTLAEAVNGTYKGKPIYAQVDAAAPIEPQKRGRGRPVKGEETAAPAVTAPALASSTTTQTPASADVDPFETPPAAPAATLDEVRAALTALKTASTQEKALAVLKKAGGADNLTGLKPEKYGAVVAAVNAELDALAGPKKAPDVDPFEVPTATAAPASKPVTLEDVKAAVVAAQKKTSTDAVQKIVMAHGGKALNPATGGDGPSLKALPEAQFAATIAAIEALPTTK